MKISIFMFCSPQDPENGFKRSMNGKTIDNSTKSRKFKSKSHDAPIMHLPSDSSILLDVSVERSFV